MVIALFGCLHDATPVRNLVTNVPELCEQLMCMIYSSFILRTFLETGAMLILESMSRFVREASDVFVLSINMCQNLPYIFVFNWIFS